MEAYFYNLLLFYKKFIMDFEQVKFFKFWQLFWTLLFYPKNTVPVFRVSVQSRNPIIGNFLLYWPRNLLLVETFLISENYVFELKTFLEAVWISWRTILSILRWKLESKKAVAWVFSAEAPTP